MVEEAQSDGVEASYGVVVEYFVEDERWEVVAKVGRVFYCVTGDLLQNTVRRIWWQGGSGGVRANLLQAVNLQLEPHGTCQCLCTCGDFEQAPLTEDRADQQEFSPRCAKWQDVVNFKA